MVWRSPAACNDAEDGSLERAGVTQGRPQSLGNATLRSDEARTPALDLPRSAASRPREEAFEICSVSMPAQRSGRPAWIHAALPEGRECLANGKARTTYTTTRREQDRARTH